LSAYAFVQRITQSSRLQRTLFRLVIFLFVAIMLVFILFPFYWMLKSSFQTNLGILSIPPKWIPDKLTLEGYDRATYMIPYGRYIRNSLITSLTAMLISTFLASMAAYALARYRFPGAWLILGLFLFTQLIPGITRMFPVYFLLQRLNLINTYLGLIIAYVSFSLPFAVMVLQAYFAGSYPLELEDAALIDGCSLFGAFWRIALPISIPGIVAIGTFVFLGAWNDFLWASILLHRGDMKTIQVGLRDFIGQMGTVNRANSFMAACVMTTIPGIILFRFAQRNLVSGLSAGAIKG
jgi:multiple sugar transport system permease protein